MPHSFGRRQANDDEGEDEKKHSMEHNNKKHHHTLSSIAKSKSIYHIGHSDTFGCHNCKQKGDKWFMQKHFCQGLK
jgi:pyruvate dehydrogenase complex dehydrogenase (E1) component